ncbi:helix-turn-helix domain-containing protein [Mycolicibacterium brumae]|uniref:XRE family transcriptional regulator n=1 Tax=Mycolicibacterium brumae TaxID=85968 RepID=A0A2G5PFS6_9MYCO|nr:helix-turn-helix transcriptional regulator [Mycolicibacterium brumae]MCV7194452.1 helix-turn-helix transcriptional regulator [Mycolicibacterium brumae]PIB77165.1 XRE family transcriptional regulator [Mycolicibacterium brumae]UWW10510.1 helix-turn-helix transcriptional regulator [Mycolicibacterium brumae]
MTAPVAPGGAADRPQPDTGRPVEFWSTAAIRAALEDGDIAVWQRIVVAIKRDPFGRTSRQVEEVLETSRAGGDELRGIAKAMQEVLSRSRTHLEVNERAEVTRHVRMLLDRSGLSQREFASRIGVPAGTFADYLADADCPSASLMIRMRRLSDRFARMRAQRDNPTVAD